LLGFFKTESNFVGPPFYSQHGARDFLLASCYMALFLNINATLGSFILTCTLGEVGFQASKNHGDPKTLAAIHCAD
jgi:Na+/melibiose symporter-like transporter